jgi:hypothetical protein
MFLITKHRPAARHSGRAWERQGLTGLTCQVIMVELMNQTRKCAAGTLIKKDNHLNR